MYNQSQKTQFITTLVNNVDYLNKQLTIRHILDFLQNNPNFNPRQAVRKTNKDSFISFIQITGFVEIDKSLIQMYVGVPIAYPKSPPVFLLAIDKQIFYVNDEQKLLTQQQIANEKNQRGQDFVRLRFPIVQKQWNPKTQNISSIFKALVQIINRPPLIKPKHQKSQQPSFNFYAQEQNQGYNYNNMNMYPNNINMYQNNMNVYQNNMNIRPNLNPNTNMNTNAKSKPLKRLDSKLMTDMVGSLHTDITQILISKQGLQQQAQNLDYNLCREQFLSQHLLTLNQKLATASTQVQQESQSLHNDLVQAEQTKTCDKLLQISETQRQKLEITCEQQALKQAEVKLRTKIQRDPNVKFSEYKKLMKMLYERMFDNQTRLLKAVK